MKKRLKLKKKVKILFIFILFVGVGSIFGYNKYKEYLYKQTNEYKLVEVGYTLDEAKNIIEVLNDENEKYFIENEKNEYVISIIKEKYFLEKNLFEYIEYKTDNKKTDFYDVIAIVNVGANKDWYDPKTIKETNIDK